jgi:hypothetical protein
MMSDQPAIAEYSLNGLKYKIGLHGIVFVWLDNGWVRSTKTVDDLTGKLTGRFRSLTE